MITILIYEWLGTRVDECVRACLCVREREGICCLLCAYVYIRVRVCVYISPYMCVRDGPRA